MNWVDEAENRRAAREEALATHDAALQRGELPWWGADTGAPVGSPAWEAGWALVAADGFSC